MRLWIGVHLPLLPLETFRPRWSEPGPHVVIDHEQVIVTSAIARDAGVRVGMKCAGVLTLCPDAQLHDRDGKREQAAIDGVALCLLQYTPEVALAAEHSLLMDVTASLRAFGGLRPLFRRVRNSVMDRPSTQRECAWWEWGGQFPATTATPGPALPCTKTIKR